MAQNFPLIAATMSLQILGARVHHTWLRVVATAVGLYSLVYYMANKPPGPYLDTWIFGMNIWGVIVKAINLFWFRDPAELTRTSKSGSESNSKQPDVDTAQTKGSEGWVGGIRELLGNAKLLASEAMEGAEMVFTLRGVGWYVLPCTFS